MFAPTKKWPTENYIELIKRINNKNIKFFLAGGNNEIENQIANKIIYDDKRKFSCIFMLFKLLRTLFRLLIRVNYMSVMILALCI